MIFSPFVVYTAGRLAVFAVVAAVLYLLGFRSWVLAFAALLLSMPVSYFVLRRQRTEFARDVERRVQERRELRRRRDESDDPDSAGDRA